MTLSLFYKHSDNISSLFFFPSNQLYIEKVRQLFPAENYVERGWPLKLRWMGTQRVCTNERGPSVLWACRVGAQDFCSALASLVGPVQIFVSSPYTVSIPLPSSPSKLGRQPCWVACLLVCVSGFRSTFQHISNEPQFAVLYAVNQWQPLRSLHLRRELVKPSLKRSWRMIFINSRTSVSTSFRA